MDMIESTTTSPENQLKNLRGQIKDADLTLPCLECYKAGFEEPNLDASE